MKILEEERGQTPTGCLKKLSYEIMLSNVTQDSAPMLAQTNQPS